MKAYSKRIESFGWGLEMYHPHPEYYDYLDPVIRALPVPLVIDHFAGMKTASLLAYQGLSVDHFDVLSQPGLATICQLLRDKKIWIKLSAPYRVSEDLTYDDVQPLVRAFVDAGSDRVLYGSDWPHPQPFHRRPKNLKGTDVEPFTVFDDAAWVKKLKSWLKETEWNALMVDNPAHFVGN